MNGMRNSCETSRVLVEWSDIHWNKSKSIRLDRIWTEFDEIYVNLSDLVEFETKSMQIYWIWCKSIEFNANRLIFVRFLCFLKEIDANWLISVIFHTDWEIAVEKCDSERTKSSHELTRTHTNSHEHTGRQHTNSHELTRTHTNSHELTRRQESKGRLKSHWFFKQWEKSNNVDWICSNVEKICFWLIWMSFDEIQMKNNDSDLFSVFFYHFRRKSYYLHQFWLIWNESFSKSLFSIDFY